MKSILELLNLIGIADNLYLLLFIWFENTMSLNDFPDRLLVFGKSSVLCINLGAILDCDLLTVVFKNFNIAIIDFGTVYFYNRSNRSGGNLKHGWNMVSFKLNIKWDRDVVSNLSP